MLADKAAILVIIVVVAIPEALDNLKILWPNRCSPTLVSSAVLRLISAEFCCIDKYCPSKSADSRLENPNLVKLALAIPTVLANLLTPKEFTAELYFTIDIASSENLTPVIAVSSLND